MRRHAASALAALSHAQDWQILLSTLLTQGDELTLRLAIEVMDEVCYQHFTDELIVDLVVAFAKCNSSTIGVLTGPEEHLPDSRLDGILDRYVEVMKAIGSQHEWRVNRDLTNFAFHLITRRLAMGTIEPAKLWYWLRPFESGGDGRKTRERLTRLLEEDATLRLGMLRYVLLVQPGESTPWARYWHLSERSAGFAPTPDDIIALLGELDPTKLDDERWRDLVQLTKHDSDNGAEVRAAAYRFAAGRPDLIAWIDDLAKPRVYEWQVKQQQREQERWQQQAKQHAEQRDAFLGRLDTIRRGEDGSVVDLAMGYLGIYRNIGDDDVPAHERIRLWLGPEVDAAAQVGFEAFLTIDPPRPTVDEIAVNFVETGYIIVAALAERHRNGLGFGDLKDEQVLAGLFALHKTKIDDHAGIHGLEDAVETEVRGRGLWISAMRRYLEPQLETRQNYVDGLRALMHDKTTEHAATDLAAEWLVRFPDLPADPEAELIDRLIRSERFDDLRSLYNTKLALGDSVRRLNWTAVGLLVDFDVMVAKLATAPVEHDLLWHVRDRASGGYRKHLIALPAEQLEWLITSFRTPWPMTGYPKDVRVGDRNPWDASDFLGALIRRLGTNAGEAATAALRRLVDATPDGYTPTIRTVAAEQERLRVESAYTPPTLAAVEAIARDRTPSDIRDLQAFMLEELAVVQDKIKGDDTDSWRGFFDDTNVPYDEERCRDHLLGLLRQGSLGITLEPEAHVADDKEVDITCTAGQVRLPIEVKGQWHAKLWQAADAQLDKLYAQDWRAGGYGIYLVLWFGDKLPSHKSLQRPGRGLPTPSTAGELRDMLASGSQAAREGRVSIVVLDLEHP